MIENACDCVSSLPVCFPQHVVDLGWHHRTLHGVDDMFSEIYRMLCLMVCPLHILFCFVLVGHKAKERNRFKFSERKFGDYLFI